MHRSSAHISFRERTHAFQFLDLVIMGRSQFEPNLVRCICKWIFAFGALTLSALPPAVARFTEQFGCGGPKAEAAAPDPGSQELKVAIASDFLGEQFSSLIDAADRWRDGRCRLKDGDMQIGYWLSGFTAVFTSDVGWNESLTLVKKFEAEYPHIPVARLVEARYWSDYANSARGFGSAPTVTKQGWKLFKERLEKSEAILLEIQGTAANWPPWYWEMIRVENLLARPREKVNQVFEEGTRHFPNVLPIYTEMQYYVEPRWGGSWSEVDRVVTTAVTNVSVEPPDATYTRMYWSTGDMMNSAHSFFRESLVSWPRMLRGFNELSNLYPTSSRIQNGLLAYACLAGDKETYVAHRAALQSFDKRAWDGAGNSVDQCDSAFGGHG